MSETHRIKNKGAGYYIEYRKKSGEIQKAQVFNSEQIFNLQGRLFCHPVNDDLTPLTDAAGKKLCSLVSIEKQTRVFGYFD